MKVSANDRYTFTYYLNGQLGGIAYYEGETGSTEMLNMYDHLGQRILSRHANEEYKTYNYDVFEIWGHNTGFLTWEIWGHP